MPVVAVVDSVLIMIFFKDHDPPHIHVEFGEHRARVSIASAKIIDGDLPVAKGRTVLTWVREHQADLSAAWADVRNERKPRRIT